MTSLLMPGSALAQSELPAFRAPMLDTPATPATFRSGLSDTSDVNDAPVTDEIKELARSLRYDPATMYKFVHDYIEWEPTWGDTKGASMTWMDRSGNAFDQASLMIALLDEAVTHNSELTIANPKYVVGEIQLTQTQVWDWLGIANDATLARQVLARGGLYGTVTASGSSITAVNMIHAWVKVTIDSVTYEFDPSFKARANENGLSSTNMELALDYDRYDFYDEADDGASIVYGWPSSVTDVNQTNINANLDTFSENLTDYIKTNYPEGDLRDVIGGRRITPVALSELPPSLLSYTVSSRDDEFASGSMPDLYRTSLRIQYEGLDETLVSSNIYGRRLSLDFNGSNQPQLVLDGNDVGDAGNACTVGTAYELTLTVEHPYDSTAFDCTVAIPVKAGGFYAVVNGWGNTGKKILAQHRNALEQYRYEEAGDTSEEVLGESYSLIGLTWLAQTSRMRQIAARFGLGSGYFHVVNHHMLGIAGHYDTPYLAVPLGHLGLASEEDTDERNAMFRSMSDHANAYQEQVIRQLQDAEAVSAGRLIEMSNNASSNDRIFLVDSAHWASTQGQLDHSPAEVNEIKAYVDAGYTMSLPEEPNLTQDDWTGFGFKAFKLSGSTLCAAYVIGDGDQYQGGSGADSGAVNAADLYSHSDIPAMRDTEGAHTHAHNDLTIGNGGLPYGLSFSRQYSSARRLQDGPVGLGWTHNLDIAATVLSDSFQSLGDDSALDAVPHIVSLYVNWDLLCAYPSNLQSVVATISQAWLLDQLTDNLATIAQGAGRMHFVKGPDGTYNEPTGQNIKLEDTGSQTFRLKDSRGKFYDFNANGTLSQWSDVFGNKVEFTYTSGKLTSVASKIGGGSTSRSLTLSYTGDHITSVTDSASRSISLGYDVDGQLTSYTNPDNNTTTYDYDASNDGRMTELYIPTDQVDPFQITVYDTLGRIKQKTNALDKTWDYYLAGYRAEIVEPNQTDPNNVTQRFSTATWLNQFGRPVLSIDKLGRQTSSEYDNLFRPTKITSPTGMSTEYEYDPNNTVIRADSFTMPGSPSEDPNTYSLFGYTSFETNGRWFLLQTSTTDPNGYETTHEYDPNGCVIETTYPEVDTPSGPNTPTVKFTYNEYGQLETKTDPAGIITEYEYYAANLGAGLKKTTVDKNGLDLTVELTYNDVGDVNSTTDPNGNTTDMEYYDSRLLKKVTDPNGHEINYEYNDNGWLLHVKQQIDQTWIYHQSITYTLAGQKATVKGPYESGNDLGINLTTYTYDDLGRPWKVTDANDNVTETRYYPDGRVWKVINAEGHAVVTNTYNDDGSLQKVVDAEGNATEYEYNGFMGLKKTIYADGTYTQPGYDMIRRMETMRTRAGDVIGVEFDSMRRLKTKTVGDNTISYSYDISGRLVSVSDGAGTISNTYDAIGRLTQTNDAHSKVIAYEYDDNSRRTKLTYPDSSYITYAYDVLNRLTEIKDDSLTVLSEYSYDARSRCTDVSYANGTSVEALYDVANRLLSIDNSTDTDSHDYDYTYDKVGNRLSMTVNDTEEHSYTYDDIYQITEVDYPTGYAYLSEDTQFSYDDAGNRSSVIENTTPSHTAPYVTNALNQYKSVDNVWYGYDENGNITHDSEFNYAYDEENRLIGVTPSAGGTNEICAAVDTDLSFTFADDANWVSTTDEPYYGNDCARSGTISDSQKATMQTTVEGPGTISFYWKVSTSSSDRLRFFVDDSMKLYVGGDQNWTLFTYDVTTMGSHTLKWRYHKDSSGSGGDDCVWIDKVVWTPKTATWYAAPRTSGSSAIWMMARTYGSPVTQYYFECLTAGGHDSGWQSSTYYMDSSLSPGQTYRYRVKGRDSSQNETGWSEVKSATTTGTIGTPAEQYAPDDWANVSYTYDAAGRRITKDVDSALTKYVYDGDHVIAEYDTDGSLLRSYIYGPGTDNPVCMIEAADNDAKYYYHRDGLGNVIALSDDAGDTVQTYEYTIYGQVAASDPNHPNPYMFTGRRYDSETGLYYYRARIYNPYIGRFLQTDPIGYSDGINWYRYCRNNPGNFVDPTGLEVYLIFSVRHNPGYRNEDGLFPMRHVDVAVDTPEGILWSGAGLFNDPYTPRVFPDWEGLVRSYNHPIFTVVFENGNDEQVARFLSKGEYWWRDMQPRVCTSYANSALIIGGIDIGTGFLWPLSLAEAAVEMAMDDESIYVMDWAEWGKYYNPWILHFGQGSCCPNSTGNPGPLPVDPSEPSGTYIESGGDHYWVDFGTGEIENKGGIEPH
jgi:RHS repeat-associated protein